MLKVLLLFPILIFFSLFPGKILAQEPKRVEVDLTNQRLYAFEGQNRVFDFIISSGKPWWPTPVGEFKPWAKLRWERMRGGSVQYGTYYDLANVPFTVYFYKSYALHGTYWHNNFGVPMSHGCVNLKTDDAGLLYNWIDFETPIKIYGQTPAVTS